MSTIVRRTFISTPQRDALETWHSIVDLLTRGDQTSSRAELMSVGGIAASVITDQAVKDAAIVVTCDGPRTRIYCLYDEDAIDGGDANEDSLGFDPLKGDWLVSLPCISEDLSWVQAALKKKSDRVVARDLSEAITPVESNKAEAAEQLTLDPKGFLGP
ncbi:MAG: hypothetical protein ABJO09_05830 [Hyphomicrobiales bacterium]|uniref:hypothetical protein n=1 Tax=Alphaproteobacteria TaxID=28211 RepID=UPI003297A9DD